MSGGFNQDEQGFFQPPANTGAWENPSAGYDMAGVEEGAEQSEFPQEPQFGQFDYSQSQGGQGGQFDYSQSQSQGADTPYGAADPYSQQQNQYMGNIMTPDASTGFVPDAENFDDEPPLLEELGINFDHIRHKTLAVLNPLKEPDASIMQDTDLAGPLVFCLAFGGALLLSGKVHFGYIYGIGVVGCLAMYALLDLMSMTGVAAACTISVLGYCILPMVLLSFFSIVASLQGIVGIILTAAIVIWCSASASKLFVSALAMDQQQLLVAYPCALVYGVFALLTVF